MRRYSFLLWLIASAAFFNACTSSTVNNGTVDSTRDEQAAKTVKSLFDTASIVKNTATFHTVEIRQMKFVPEDVKVHKGDTIAWINNDIVTHDVTEEKNKEWTSSPLPIGKMWQMVASKSSDYYCSIHVVMKGKITVE